MVRVFCWTGQGPINSMFSTPTKEFVRRRDFHLSSWQGAGIQSSSLTLWAEKEIRPNERYKNHNQALVLITNTSGRAHAKCSLALWFNAMDKSLISAGYIILTVVQICVRGSPVNQRGQVQELDTLKVRGSSKRLLRPVYKFRRDP